MFIFGLTPSINDTLNWSKLLPINARDALPLLAWTAPFLAISCALHYARDAQAGGGSGKPTPLLGRAATIAADELQRCNRKLNVEEDELKEDLPLLFAFETAGSCAVSAIWLYGVLPPFVSRLGGGLVRPPAICC